MLETNHVVRVADLVSYQNGGIVSRQLLKKPAGNVTQAILGTDLGTIVSNGEPATSR